MVLVCLSLSGATSTLELSGSVQSLYLSLAVLVYLVAEVSLLFFTGWGSEIYVSVTPVESVPEDSQIVIAKCVL